MSYYCCLKREREKERKRILKTTIIISCSVHSCNFYCTLSKSTKTETNSMHEAIFLLISIMKSEFTCSFFSSPVFALENIFFLFPIDIHTKKTWHKEVKITYERYSCVLYLMSLTLLQYSQ